MRFALSIQNTYFCRIYLRKYTFTFLILGSLLPMRHLTLLLLIIFSAINSFSQITINFPTSRATFQRDKNNSADVYITGNIGKIVDRVDARFVPMNAGQGSATEWAVIQNNPISGVYSGKLKGTGGWYRLEVRAISNGQIVESTAIDRIGIGEVFVVAGQSNARGRRDYGEKKANDDRVNTIEFYNINAQSELPFNFTFTHLDKETYIAPFGESSWCWGELGDLLTARLNVPVMFFNAAWEGSTITNWRESAEGLSTVNVDGSGNFPKGFPYLNLRNTLNQYISILGIRAILWHQGETDTSPGKTSEATYASNLQKLIELSRQHSGKNISWMVSKVSYTYPGLTSTDIINAQNRVINTAQLNVFEGPSTDGIDARLDGIHFANISPELAGLTQLAKAWDNQMNDNFFSNSIPLAGAPLIALQAKCGVNNSVTISQPINYQSYRWSNGATSKDITVSTGSYSAFLRDATGNYSLSTTINTSYLALESSPTIFAKSATSFCQGNSVDLTANTDLQRVRWSTGDTTKTITVKAQGNYTVSGINQQGCITVASNAISTVVFPLPVQPAIIYGGQSNACEGDNITLASSISIYKSFWDGPVKDSTQLIVLSKAGEYSNLRVRIRDNNGCYSPYSEPVSISIKPRPKTPEITQIGTFVLQAKSSDLQPTDTFEWKRDAFVQPQRTQTIKASQQGFFSVVVNRFYQIGNNQSLTCRSQTSGVVSFIPDPAFPLLSVYPNPSTDGKFYLEAKENIGDMYVEIFSLIGQRIGAYPLPDFSQRQILDLSALPAGEYLLRFMSNSVFEAPKTLKVRIK